MATPRRRIVLVSRNDRAWINACEQALTDKGIDSVEAYSCWSAEFMQEREDPAAFVVDGHVLCEFVSAERPGPVLQFAPKLPVVIFNAEVLDEPQRAAAMAHNALMMEGDDVAEIARGVDTALPAS